VKTLKFTPQQVEMMQLLMGKAAEHQAYLEKKFASSHSAELKK